MSATSRLIPTNDVVTHPVDEPVSVDEVKANAYVVDDENDNAFIRTDLIPTARRFVEQLAGRSLMTQTRRQSYDGMPCSPIYLRYGPVQSITSFVYMDTSQVSQTLATSYYTLDSRTVNARLCEAYNQTWPAALCDTNSVTITYVAGYGSNVGKVPVIYRRAIIALCTHWYQFRDAFGCEDASGILGRIEDMLSIEGRTVEYA